MCTGFSFDQDRLDGGGADPVVAPDPGPGTCRGRDGEGAAGQGAVDRTGPVNVVGAGARPVDRAQQPGTDGRTGQPDLPRGAGRLVNERVLTGPVAGRAPRDATQAAGGVSRWPRRAP